MTQFKPGDLVQDKITKKKYYVLKIIDVDKPRDTPLAKIGGLFADPLKEDLFCKNEQGQKGMKYSAEVELVKK